MLNIRNLTKLFTTNTEQIENRKRLIPRSSQKSSFNHVYLRQSCHEWNVIKLWMNI